MRLLRVKCGEYKIQKEYAYGSTGPTTDEAAEDQTDSVERTGVTLQNGFKAPFAAAFCG
jgi:hypothetical protein